jgi:hypothetical protein
VISVPACPIPLEAVLRLEREEDCRVLHGAEWLSGNVGWLIRVRLSIGAGLATVDLPAETEWVIRTTASYPFGPVEVYPAVEHGVTATFPHQSRNSAPVRGVPFRAGMLCLDDPWDTLGGARPADPDPVGEADERLAWYVGRLREWVHAAATGRLAVAGDPFELPDARGRLDLRTALTAETTASLGTWMSSGDRVGTARLCGLRSPSGFEILTDFRTIDRRPVGPPLPDGVSGETENKRRASSQGTGRALWFLLDATPIVAPWGLPETWADLDRVARVQGVSLSRAAPKPRELLSHWLALGVSIPSVIGGAAVRLHWLMAKLVPPNTHATRWPPDPDTIVQWRETENWTASELGGRGQSDALRAVDRMVLVGAGALGAPMAELLVRAGVSSIGVVDHGLTDAGNLVRHPATLDDVGQSKATTLASRLRRTRVGVRSDFIRGRYPIEPTAGEALRAASLIVDASADPGVLAAFKREELRSDAAWASIRMTAGAEELYLSYARGPRVPIDAVTAMLRPHLDRAAQRLRALQLPRDGIGCWHPALPARVDHVNTLVASATSWLETALAADERRTALAVFARTPDGGLSCNVEWLAS